MDKEECQQLTCIVTMGETKHRRILQQVIGLAPGFDLTIKRLMQAQCKLTIQQAYCVLKQKHFCFFPTYRLG
jgi:hypothetical protein